MTRLLALTACLIVLVLATGCAAIPDERDEPFEMDFGRPITYDGRHAVVFFIDSVNHRVFNRLLEKGELPNIKRYFAERGTVVDHAVTCVPSVTYSAMTTFLTGLGPGHNGVPALEWADRHEAVYRWYTTPQRKYTINDDYTAPNLYEMLDDQFTVTILNQLTRGATRYIENWYTVGPAYFFGMHHLVDRLSLIRFAEVNKLARLRKQYPRFTITHLPGTDSIGHETGPDHRTYRESLRHMDAQLGRLLRAMEQDGVLEEITIVLISDHGVTDTSRRKVMRLVPWFNTHFSTPATGRIDTFELGALDRTKLFDRYGIIVSYSGDRQAFVYLRMEDDPWRVQPTYHQLTHVVPDPEAPRTVHLPKLLLQSFEGIDVAVVRHGPASVMVFGHRGTGRIDRRIVGREKLYRYRVVEGTDPLHYDNIKLVGDSWHTDLQWLAATATTDRPDAVVGLCDLMDSRRTGDVALFAKVDWQFGDVNHGGHGGLNREDMLVPFMIAGPGIARRRIPTARIADLTPTLLEVLGYRHKLADLPMRDGRSLWPLIRASAGEPEN